MVANENTKLFKLGKWILILLGLFSIPVDVYRAKEDLKKSESVIDSASALTVITFYGSTIATHIIGLVGAFDDQIWLTVGARMISTLMYQYEWQHKPNTTIPKTQKGLKKLTSSKKFQEVMNRRKAKGKPSNMTWEELIIYGLKSISFSV